MTLDDVHCMPMTGEELKGAPVHIHLETVSENMAFESDAVSFGRSHSIPSKGSHRTEVSDGCASHTATKRWVDTVNTGVPGSTIADIEAALRSRQSVCTNDGDHEAMFTVVQTLGSGGFGVVTEVHDREGRPFALKAIKLVHLKDSVRFGRELSVHKLMRHPNIVRLHHYFKTSDCYYLIMDLCTGGDLLAVVRGCLKLDFFSQPLRKGLPGPAIAPYIWQMLSGIAYMHHNRLAHRDVKTENYMVMEKPNNEAGYNWPQLQLIDFGVAREFKEGERMRSQVGSVSYVAPEVMGNTKGYTETCDVWSIGATAYVVASGIFPFEGVGDEILEIAKSRDVSFKGKDWDRHAKPLKELIKQMMNRNPDERPTPRSLIETNDWLIKNGAPDRVVKGPGGACCSIS